MTATVDDCYAFTLEPQRGESYYTSSSFYQIQIYTRQIQHVIVIQHDLAFM